jgi:16S rRNA (adenine1518-N6/adenine1519-N6)-dimethyltransferase
MRQLLNTNRVLPKKSLGQNFIIDDNFLLKMNSHIDSSQNNIIIEIGPGKGALTEYLTKKNFKKLFLIEKDNYLACQLKLKYEKIKNIYIINDDALKFDYNIFKNIKEKVILYGNLPFNISTKLLTKWIADNEWPSFFDKMILMFQKEVADRIVANHNNKKYGRLSVLVQSRCDVKKILDAPASIFSPKPKVDGAVIQLKPINNYCNVSFNNLETLLERSFSSRRKKIKNTLSKHKQLLTELGIDENLRPENLSVSNYCKLAKLID